MALHVHNTINDTILFSNYVVSDIGESCLMHIGHFH